MGRYVLVPIRGFLLDPILAVSTLLLPSFAQISPMIDSFLAMIVSLNLKVLSQVYQVDNENVDLRQTARNDLLHNNNKATTVITSFHLPPSDFISSIRGGMAFALSAWADVVSMVMDRQKMNAWFQAVTDFKAFLDASGVGNELEEAIAKPLRQGRLLDNVKILNDIQEEMYVDRCKRVASGDISEEDIAEPLQEGKR